MRKQRKQQNEHRFPNSFHSRKYRWALFTFYVGIGSTRYQFPSFKIGIGNTNYQFTLGNWYWYPTEIGIGTFANDKPSPIDKWPSVHITLCILTNIFHR